MLDRGTILVLLVESHRVADGTGLPILHFMFFHRGNLRAEMYPAMP